MKPLLLLILAAVIAGIAPCSMAPASKPTPSAVPTAKMPPNATQVDYARKCTDSCARIAMEIEVKE